jgi:crotonobetainyl-CoA:carnitine CoA-transferase CaiB-like acyl-CoA transferase
MGALTGLRILDLSRVLAGPYCTQMLGDLGAEILKIEKPFAGDDTRYWGPPFLKDAQGHNTTESAYYLSVNRNKKSVAIDIAKEEGQKLILSLLDHCDILIENFKVGGLKKYGLDYDTLKEKFPRLIVCSITGYGQNGPLATEPGYDLVSQAMGGLMATTGVPGGDPMKASVAVSDIITGLHAAIGILAALQSRHQTGKGQHIDVALLDCTLATMTNLAQYYLTSGHTAPRQGNGHATIVPYQAVKAKDGWLVIAVGNDHQFSKLATLLGHPEWADDDRFRTNTSRLQNRETLIPLINTAMSDYLVADLVEKCRDIDIPAGPVNTLDKTFSEPQVLARGMEITLPHPLSHKPIHLVGSPLKLSETPVTYNTAPPVIGEHTVEVLSGMLGLGEASLTDLTARRIIQSA